MWMWLVASILFIVGNHLSYHGANVSPDVIADLYGACSVFYLLVGLCLTPLPYLEATEYLEPLERLRSALTIMGDSEQEMFARLDMRGEGDDGGDGSLDDGELYESLVDAGVLIPNETFLKLFHQADTSKDGKLQVNEFVLFLKNTEVPTDKMKYSWEVVKLLPLMPSIIGAVLFTLAGLGLVLCSYLDDLTQALNWCAVGSIAFMIVSLIEIVDCRCPLTALPKLSPSSQG